MPPHCDSIDGPVVVAAQKALATEVVEDVLPYIPADGEEEVREAFELVTKARSQGPEASAVADRYFFETVVRIHRAGEGAPFTGLKPAGLDVGPVIPIAEDAIAEGTPEQLIEFFITAMETEIEARFEGVVSSAKYADIDVAHAREHVEATLGLQVWAHKMYSCLKGPAHGDHHEHG